jgi:aspartyl-tRNA(Asn)/glutamyl-tRNA(Gln) amidotransferase subunit A
MVELTDALVRYAGWLGYGHGERAASWLRRLEVNAPELAAFRDAPTPPHAAYGARPVVPSPADGVTASAPAALDGAAALERARQREDLKAFTWLPEALAPSARGLLSGAPVAVKDLMHVEGMPLSGGSRAIDRAVCTRDAEVVARLKRAGAVVMGLTNLHELAYGITSDNPHFGRVVNPLAPGRIPGGSSGGSAAAVAAGIVNMAVGTDTAGSIRIPAACCGVVGFKPSYDAVPRAGVLDLAPTLDHVGPMGASVADCAALFAAMLGLPALPAWAYASLANRTVARLGGYFEQPLDEEVRHALDAALRALAADGALCIDRAIDGAALAPAIQLNTICAEATAVHAERLRDRGADLGEDVRVRLEMGHFIPGHWYVKAQCMRQALVERIEAALEGADVLICGTLRTPAPAVGEARVRIGDRDYALHTALTHLTLPFNLAGLPAVSVPWTLSRDGVPIGLQVVAARGADWRALAVAQRLELASPWRRRELASPRRRREPASP